MMFRELEPLGEEYYQLIMKEPEKTLTLRALKKLFWGIFLISLFFNIVVLPAAYSSAGSTPPALKTVNLIVVIYTLIYGLAVVMVSPNRILLKSIRVRAVLQSMMGLSIQLFTLNTFMTVMVAANKGSVLYMLPFALIALFGVACNIWILLRAKKQILKGALKEDGAGLFNVRNTKFAKRVWPVAAVVLPAFTSMFTGLVLFNIGLHRLEKFVDPVAYRTPTPPFQVEVLYPILLSLVSLIIVTVGAAVTYSAFLMLHLHRKFGYWWPLAANPPKKSKGKL